jgi:heterodisulfide reductase subunit B
MRYYSYYPGCSSEATAKADGLATKAVAKALGIELFDLEDWNCCGTTPYSGVDELEATCIASRNLALAEKRGLGLVTSCSSCYITLNKANLLLSEQPKLKEQVNKALAAANLEYRGGIRVRHFADILLNDISPQVISSKIRRSLDGLRVAPYYGCQLARPGYGFDNPESPQSLDILVRSVGGEAVPFPLKGACCGGSLIIPEMDLALGLIYKILHSAQQNGAQCLVTPCPLCQTNLDAYQSKVEGKFKVKFDLPVLFLSQLVGVALGIAPKALGLEKNIVSATKILAPYL